MVERFIRSHTGGGEGKTHLRSRLEMRMLIGGISTSSEGNVIVPQAVLPVIINLEDAFARDRGILEESWPRLMSLLKNNIVEPIFRERSIVERESKRVDMRTSRSNNNSKRKVVAPLRFYGVERKAEGDGIVIVYRVRKTTPRFDLLTWVAGEKEVRSMYYIIFFIVLDG